MDKAIETLINSKKEILKSIENTKNKLVRIWDTIPSFDSAQNNDTNEKFQMLQGTNMIYSKIAEMIDSYGEISLLGSEKDYLNLYHGDFLDCFVQSSSQQQFRMLSGCSKKTTYIFDDIQRNNVRNLSGNLVKSFLCFIIKDNCEILCFLKNTGPAISLVAMWTNSKSIIHSMSLLFEMLWYKSRNNHL